MILNQKIAIVDLTKQKVKTFSASQEQRRTVLSGRSLAAYLLFQHLSPGSDSLGPNNVIIISAGLLGGTLTTPFALGGLMTKSPLSGCFEYAPLDGLFTAGLKWAGFEQVIIKGRARKPVYLFLHHDQVEIRDATSVWGQSPADTFQNLIIDTASMHVCGLGIGIAGENQVRFANVITDRHQAIGRTGFGAVFGSKNVKAVMCGGGDDLDIKQPEAVLGYSAEILEDIGKNISEAPLEVTGSNGSITIAEISTSACLPINYRTWLSLREAAIDLGMDYFTLAIMIQWSSDLCSKGMSGVEAMSDVICRNGEQKSAAIIAQTIADRSAGGDLLAEGPLRAAAKIGLNSHDYFRPLKWLVKAYAEDAPDPSIYFAKNKTKFEAFKRRHLRPVSKPKAQSDQLVSFGKNVKTSDIVPSIENKSVDGPMGPISRAEILNMIADTVGFNGADCKQRIRHIYGLEQVIKLVDAHVGPLYDANELVQIGYRACSIERLLQLREIDTAQKKDKRAANFYVSVAHIPLSTDQWERMTVTQFFKEANRIARSNGWIRRKKLNPQLFKRLEIGNLWPVTT